MLTSAGMEVVEAADGIAGLALFLDSPPDLLITDISMPGIDGIDTIRQVRAINPDIPIIAMSGGGRGKYHDTLGTARDSGAIETLKKPFRRAQLLAAVSRALAGAN